MLSNISRSKGNQAMKFDQLVEYNMRNIFLEKSYTKWGGEGSLRSIYKKSKLSMSLVQQWNVIELVFIVCPNERLPKYIKTKVLATYFYLI